MLVIFYSVTACSSEESQQQGICMYKQEMSMVSTCIMISLIGLRYMKDKKKKKRPQDKKAINPESK